MFQALREDFRACFERDPAARSSLEVLFCYPGFHAILMHRIAHWFFNIGLVLIARMISHFNRFVTGIEIHPGAEIGTGFFIDHGMGVVIGETSVIGHDVTLFQGVTLGGTGKTRTKRHPTLEDNVVVGAGAKVLGDITIGQGSRIGSGSVVVQSVQPNSTVVGIPGRVVKREGEKIPTVSLDHTDLPDPVVESMHTLQERIDDLQHQLIELKQKVHQEDETLEPAD
ncbi:MAG: serine O-acetyltransferase [bacterium]